MTDWPLVDGLPNDSVHLHFDRSRAAGVFVHAGAAAGDQIAR
jgi:hypothetical protein